MALIEKRDASRGELKWFGLMFAAFFALLGAIVWWRTRHAPLHTAAIVLWCIGGGVALIYYLVPALQRPFYDLWLGLFYPIGWVVSHTMIAITFYLVITPIGLIMRLIGRDPMNRAFDRAAETYWVPHDPAASSSRYFQQF